MGRTEISKLGFVVLATLIVSGEVSASPAFAQDAPASQQDQPSVADAARASAVAKKDKDKSAAVKTVITEDSLGSGAGVPSKSASGAHTAAVADPADKFKTLDEAWGKLQITEVALDQLEPLNKPELVNLVLQGNTTNFPNRAEWEEKLFVAKANYVQRSRQLILVTRQLLTDIADLQTKQGQLAPNDPHVQALAKKSKQLTQLATRTEADFQSAVNEGKNALLQASR
jgi:hypothetical protein